MRLIYITLILLFLGISAVFSQLTNTVYNQERCGLNFFHKSVKVTSREPNPAGNPTPVTVNISELTSCRRVERAYVWWGVSYRAGSPIAPRLTIVTPSNQTIVLNSTTIGTAGHKCWSEQGTRNFRVDVTSAITGNGNYRLDVDNDDWEVDGITLLVIYRDLQANYLGRLHIEDGIFTTPGGATYNHAKTGQNFCANSSFAQAFILVSDLQRQFNPNSQVTFNFNGTPTQRQANFWNFEVFNTSVTQAQTTYTYSFTTSNDCFSVILAGLYTQTTTCRSCPERLNVTASSNLPRVCSGGSVTLDASGASTYQWTSIPAGFNSTQKSPNANPTVTTDYIVRGTSTDGCEVGFDTVRVIVNPQPIARAGNDVNVCGGKSVVIGLPATGGTPPYSYQWSSAVGLSATNIAQPTASPAVPTQYIITVTDANGCISRDTVRVGIFPAPSVKASNTTSICNGESTQLSATGSGGTAPYTYSWSPTGNLSNPNVSNPTANPTTTTTYTVIITDANGCQSADSVIITVFPLPVINLGNNIEICLNESTQLNAAVSSGTPPYSFQWSPSTNLSNPNIANPIANPTITTQYTLTVTDNNECTNSAIINVIVNPLPTLKIGNDVEICFGDTISIGNTAQNGTPPFNYQWTPVQGLITNNLPIVQVNPLATTTYYCNVTDSKGCRTVDSITVTVNPLPQPVITPLGPTTFCSCDSLTLDAGGPYVSYLWSTGETTRTITVKQTGTFTVSVIDDKGCRNTSSPITTTVVNPNSVVAMPETILTVAPGNNISIPIYIKSSNDLDFCKVFNFTTTIRYNKSLLVPKGSTPIGIISGDDRIITINGTRRVNDSILFLMHFLATLGNAERTDIRFDSFEWTDCQAGITLLDSVFALDSLCREGGTARLFKEEIGTPEILVFPNPTNDNATIVAKIPYKTNIKIKLFDALGNEKLAYFESINDSTKIVTNLETRDLISGAYILVLATDYETITTIVEVVK